MHSSFRTEFDHPLWLPQTALHELRSRSAKCLSPRMSGPNKEESRGADGLFAYLTVPRSFGRRYAVFRCGPQPLHSHYLEQCLHAPGQRGVTLRPPCESSGGVFVVGPTEQHRERRASLAQRACSLVAIGTVSRTTLRAEAPLAWVLSHAERSAGERCSRPSVGDAQGPSFCRIYVLRKISLASPSSYLS